MLFAWVVAAVMTVASCSKEQSPPVQRAQPAGAEAASEKPPDVGDEPSPFDVPAELLSEMDELPGESDQEPPRRPDVHFVPTPQEVVNRMLELANVTKDDVVYDLGCGDGRIVVTAAKKYGCKAIGVDIDPQRVAESLKNVRESGAEELVQIKEGDIFELDLTPASVITLYLLPNLNVRLIPQLEKLKPGTRIVSHAFDMRGVKPDTVEDVEVEDGGSYRVYMWTTPLQKEDNPADEFAPDDMPNAADAPSPFDVPVDLLSEMDEVPAGSDRKPSRTPDVIYVPTPQDVVDRMLELAKVTKDDFVYDLGCGDGRIVVTAAKKYGCKAIGVDIDPQRVEESLKNVGENNVEDLVEIKEGDIFQLDLTPASVITLYLLPELNRKLIPQLEKLKPGTRIVSHAFDMRGVKPEKVETVQAERGTSHTVYYWITPLQKEDDADADADDMF